MAVRVTNQPPPLRDYNLVAANRPLLEGVQREGADWAEDALLALGDELGGEPLPDEVAARVRALSVDDQRRATLREHLSHLLEGAEVAAFDARLDLLAAAPVYPHLDPWDGRPFEWW